MFNKKLTQHYSLTQHNNAIARRADVYVRGRGRCDGRYGSIGGSGSRYQTRRRIPFSLADMVLAGTTSAVWHTSTYGGLDSPQLYSNSRTRAHFAMSYLQACMQKTDHFRQAQTPQTRKIRLEFALFYPHLIQTSGSNHSLRKIPGKK